MRGTSPTAPEVGSAMGGSNQILHWVRPPRGGERQTVHLVLWQGGYSGRTQSPPVLGPHGGGFDPLSIGG